MTEEQARDLKRRIEAYVSSSEHVRIGGIGQAEYVLAAEELKRELWAYIDSLKERGS